jgi:hypothetical protein
MNSNIRTAATQCSLGTWLVLGIYVYILSIKEISMMVMIIIIISERALLCPKVPRLRPLPLIL